MGRLQTARLENFIRRWGSIKGPGSVLSETLGDVFPVLDLENLTPENLLPAGWFPIAGHATVTGGVAQLGGVQIANLANSGLIAVIDKFTIQGGASQQVTFGTNQAIFVAVAVTPRNRDTRAGSTFNAMLTLRTNVNSATEFFAQIAADASGYREFSAPSGVAVLGPGSALTVVSTTQNVGLRVSFYGHVRIAEPSELSF